MTNTDFSTTTATALQPAIEFVVFDVTAQAQRAGNAAYAAAEAAGMSNEDRADAYHIAFVTTSAELGVYVPCSCEFCATH